MSADHPPRGQTALSEHADVACCGQPRLPADLDELIDREILLDATFSRRSFPDAHDGGVAVALHVREARGQDSRAGG